MKSFPVNNMKTHFIFAVFLGVLANLILANSVTVETRLLITITVTSLMFMFFIEKYIRRYLYLQTDCPSQWQTILLQKVPFYRKLDPEGRRRFEKDVMIFIKEQRIFGVRGEEVSEEIKVLVAASAAILGFGLPGWEWPNFRDILVYPTGFDEDYNIEQSHPLKGMVHQQGPIIFSEEDLKHGFYKNTSGFNVGLHEMAHVLDMADGRADGVPSGMNWFATAPWIKLMADRIQKIRSGQCKAILRDYAGVNQAEFFAVAVEAFYERPSKLRQSDPELFKLLQSYFGVDPENPR